MNHIRKISALFALTVFLSLSLCACKNKNNNTFTLSGTITGKQPESIVLKYNKDTLTISDTVRVKDGKFEFTGEINEPVVASINLLNEMIWLEPTTMYIEIDTDKSACKLTGSKTQNDQVAFYQKIDSVSNMIRGLSEKTMLLKDSIDKTNDKALKQRLTAKRDSLLNEISEKQPKSSDIQTNYVKENPNSFLSAVLLFPLNSSEVIPLDTAIALYENLDAKVQQSYFGKKINTDISLLKQNRIGAPAPDFEANDPIRQQPLKLSDLRGKVILLDFWAPWCGPCRRGFKSLKPLHDKYSAKGFEIIAIYTDKQEDKDSWIKAINDEDIRAWHQVKIAENMLPGKETPEDIRSKYYVQAIPRKILIDRNGKIVKYWVGTSDTIEKEVEENVHKLVSEY